MYWFGITYRAWPITLLIAETRFDRISGKHFTLIQSFSDLTIEASQAPLRELSCRASCQSFTSHYCTFIQHTWPCDWAHTRLSSSSKETTKLSIASGPRCADKHVSYSQMDKVSVLVSPRTVTFITTKDIHWLSLYWTLCPYLIETYDKLWERRQTKGKICFNDGNQINNSDWDDKAHQMGNLSLVLPPLFHPSFCGNLVQEVRKERIWLILLIVQKSLKWHKAELPHIVGNRTLYL